MTVKQRLEAGLLQLGLVCQVEPLLQYVDLLVKWNHVYNLTAVKTPEEMITRHLLDSLAIAPYLRGGENCRCGFWGRFTRHSFGDKLPPMAIYFV